LLVATFPSSSGDIVDGDVAMALLAATPELAAEIKALCTNQRASCSFAGWIAPALRGADEMDEWLGLPENEWLAQEVVTLGTAANIDAASAKARFRRLRKSNNHHSDNLVWLAGPHTGERVPEKVRSSVGTGQNTKKGDGSMLTFATSCLAGNSSLSRVQAKFTDLFNHAWQRHLRMIAGLVVHFISLLGAPPPTPTPTRSRARTVTRSLT
jgi:hypothetical protein